MKRADSGVDRRRSRPVCHRSRKRSARLTDRGHVAWRNTALSTATSQPPLFRIALSPNLSNCQGVGIGALTEIFGLGMDFPSWSDYIVTKGDPISPSPLLMTNANVLSNSPASYHRCLESFSLGNVYPPSQAAHSLIRAHCLKAYPSASLIATSLIDSPVAEVSPQGSTYAEVRSRPFHSLFHRHRRRFDSSQRVELTLRLAG